MHKRYKNVQKFYFPMNANYFSTAIHKIGFIWICLSSLLCACHDSDEPRPDSGDWLQTRLASMNRPRPADAYDYPCLPGTSAWAELTTDEERHEACLIPDSIVLRQSTDGLIQDIWEYPLLSDLIYFSSSTGLQKVFAESFIPQSNMYKELLTREDLTACLTERYRLLDPALDREYITCVFEALLGMDEIIGRMSLSEQKEIIGLAIEKDRIREKSGSVNIPPRSIAWYVIGRMLQWAEYEPFVAECARNEVLSNFLKTSILSEPNETINRIALFGKEFIKNKSN